MLRLVIPRAPSPTYLGVKKIICIPTAKIIVGKRRRALDHAKVDFMTESIKANGMLHPISVCAVGDEFHLVTGEHRLEAAKKLGWRTIEAIKISDAAVELWELDENLARANLSPDEEQRATKAAKRDLAKAAR